MAEKKLILKSEQKREFEDFIKNSKGKEEYDCLLLYSGGKDSTYLLHLLKKEYKLNILALTIDTGLLQPLIKSNINRIIDKMDVDHIFFKPKNNFYKRLYRYSLTHRNDKELFSIRTCGVCQKVMHSIALKIAAQMKIPFIALAYSPDQEIFLKDRLFENPNNYQMPHEKLLKNWTPDEVYTKSFLKNDDKYFWNPEGINPQAIPAFICPFYILDYPEITEIFSKLKELDLGSKKDFHPDKTECSLAWLLAYLDINLNKNLIPSSKEISERSGSSQLHVHLGTQLLKYGMVKNKDIKNSLNFLNLKIEDIK